MLRLRTSPAAAAATARRASGARVCRPLCSAAASTDAPSTSALSGWRPGCAIRMLYDGECSLCMKEVNFLRKRDAGKGRIDFVDIAAPDYSADANAGITYEQVRARAHGGGACAAAAQQLRWQQQRACLAARPRHAPRCNAQAMDRIHAVLPDGRIVRDVEVFRRLYEAVDLGWVYAITSNKAVEDAANVVYGFWAKYRTQITGREALEVILARRRAEAAGRGGAGSLCRDAEGSASGACELPAVQAQEVSSKA